MTEIFKQRDVENFIDNDDEFQAWKSTAEELKMEGQSNLITSKALIPYPLITSKQDAIINALCPSVSNIKNYEEGLIPKEVLEEIKNCNSLFSELKIRYGEDTICFLIGIKSEEGKYNPPKYLIAKWGSEEKLDWTYAYNIAYAELMRDWSSKLERRISLCNGQLGRLSADITRKLSGEWINCEG